MNTTKNATRSLLAAGTAGVLLVGGASGAMAHGNHRPAPAPQKTVRILTVDIARHAPIDLAKVTPTTSLRLRSAVWDPKRVVPKTATVDMTLAIYTKRVGGTKVAGTDSTATSLALKSTRSAKKLKFYGGSAVLSSVWTADQIAALKTALTPGKRLFACVSSADLVGVTGETSSTQVKKRLGTAKGKAVRECVAVVDSTPVK